MYLAKNAAGWSRIRIVAITLPFFTRLKKSSAFGRLYDAVDALIEVLTRSTLGWKVWSGCRTV